MRSYFASVHLHFDEIFRGLGMAQEKNDYIVVAIWIFVDTGSFRIFAV